MTEMRSNREAVMRGQGLAVRYGRRTILSGVDIDVRAGDFWFLLGPNGQGKTTLLRCLLRLVRPSAGTLWVNPAIGGWSGIGFVPQRCDLNPTLPTTVREFVLLGLVGVHCRSAERADRLAWALDRVGLGGQERADYWSLSGGQRQRALVARALVRKPKVLVLDEPTNGLDVTTEDSLLTFIADLNAREQLTVLFVTHDLAVAARHGSHFALFHDGTATTGPVDQVLRPETLQRTYGIPIDIMRDVTGTCVVQLGSVRSGNETAVQ